MEVTRLQKWQAVVLAGIRAHSTCIRASIPFTEAFVILHGNHIDDMRAITKGLQAEFFPIQFLLNDHAGRTPAQQFLTIIHGLFHRKKMSLG